MKKIFNILIVAVLAGVAFTACDDDDDKWVGDGTSTLQVLSRETSFPAAASQGTIVVDTTDPVTVTSSDQGWVTTAVDGNKVTVSVTENTSLDGRNATLTIKAGDRMTEISVMQAGLIFDTGGVLSIGSGDDEVTYTYPIKANAPVTVSTNVDWCHVEITGDGGRAGTELVVKLDANTTGHVRRGEITYKIGTLEDVIPVTQCDFVKDLAGTYILYFNDGQKDTGFYANLAKSGTKYTLDLGDGDVLPVVYDAANAAITVKAGQFVRNFAYQGKTYYMHTLVYDTNSGYLTWSTAAGMVAKMQYGLLQGTPVTLGFFEDDGAWGTYVSTAILIELFTSKTTVNASTRAGLTYLEMRYPYLLRIHDTEEAAASAATPVSIAAPQRNGVVPMKFSDYIQAAEASVDVDATTARIVR